ncbi:hypothetical protein H8356DRAFT_948900 [Neocallimastix lanati (nom. inval.)]|jgi:hypothetical protein|uniref:Uncharacterized protein n=1 Tax=Neocallimastix californiae TaxID=1754190 RepID=A0A1Y2ER44_9FUNG|nr:hypothetical protein H8356DRAFT_948900 [Neocallimastix sp. JGI-2020a]ORY73305.1 hypothetical protein LY90DRAFT_666691 [Neocallimastix californiae]|eukprot:ORY73305.1 hypothetical protein LY90DRAFT_666691 [Neocallimastix californiae]
MLCRYIIALVFFVATALCATCGRDIDCLANNAQMTFIGRVMSVEQNNSTYFSAEVQPLCTMHSTVANTKIDDEEFKRTVTVDGFGTHAGGSCNADSGIVGDTNIFFVWVNASLIHGQARHFGLYDPCYGAFKYDDQNAQLLSNFMSTHSSAVQTPIGQNCPTLPKPFSNTNADGTPGSVNLEDGIDSGSVLRYTFSSLALIASLLAYYLM